MDPQSKQDSASLTLRQEAEFAQTFAKSAGQKVTQLEARVQDLQRKAQAEQRRREKIERDAIVMRKQLDEAQRQLKQQAGEMAQTAADQRRKSNRFKAVSAFNQSSGRR